MRCATSPSWNGDERRPVRRSGPQSRPRDRSARSVGRPATRSSSRDCSVAIARSAAAERSEVVRPINVMKIGMSGSAIETITADRQSYNAITTTVAGVSIAAARSAGRYAVKYSRRPSRPRVTRMAASSRCSASWRGDNDVVAVSTERLRSAITSLAPRWASRPCCHVTSVRNVHSSSRIDSGTSSRLRLRSSGSVITRATMSASTTAEAIVAPAISTPHAVDDTRKRRIAVDARHRRGSTGPLTCGAATIRSRPEWRRR